MLDLHAEGRVTFAYQGFENEDANNQDSSEFSNGQILRKFKEFIAHAQPGDARYTYHYRQVCMPAALTA